MLDLLFVARLDYLARIHALRSRRTETASDCFVPVDAAQFAARSRQSPKERDADRSEDDDPDPRTDGNAIADNVRGPSNFCVAVGGGSPAAGSESRL